MCLLQPHAVSPSLGNGLQIHCNVGQHCPVPVFIHGTSPTPEITTGQKTPGIWGTLTPPNATSLMPDTLTSTLTLTPTTSGTNRICVNVTQGSDVDVVCYTVISDPIGTTVAPTQAPTGGVFSGATPPNEAHITCRKDTACHFIAQTQPNGTHCPEVRSQTVGVYTYPEPAESQMCNTDVLVDPNNLKNTSDPVCISLGTNGEIRCFTVDTIDPTNDPCEPSLCHHGGECVNTPGSTPAFKCVCPPFFTGQTCNETDTPITHGINITKPHLVVPSLSNGFQINCTMGHTCPIPVFVHGTNPLVTPGLKTPGISGSLTPTTPTNILPDTQTATPNSSRTHSEARPNAIIFL